MDGICAGASVAAPTKDKTDDKEPEDGSLMVYAPLIPDANSHLEVAESVFTASETDVDNDPEQNHTSLPNPTDPAEPNSDDKPQKDEKEKEKEVRVWIPSITSISLKLTWWGFSLYLPPPVLATLQSHAPSIAQRSAMITTALKYILDKLPMAVIPLPARPAVMVARRVVLPVLGVVGAGVAGAWAGVLSYDKGKTIQFDYESRANELIIEGYGVILTATWILPVALLPSTWDAEAFKIAEEHAATKVVPSKVVEEDKVKKSEETSTGKVKSSEPGKGKVQDGPGDASSATWWKFGKDKKG